MLILNIGSHLFATICFLGNNHELMFIQMNNTNSFLIWKFAKLVVISSESSLNLKIFNIKY